MEHYIGSERTISSPSPSSPSIVPFSHLSSLMDAHHGTSPTTFHRNLSSSPNHFFPSSSPSFPFHSISSTPPPSSPTTLQQHHQFHIQNQQRPEVASPPPLAAMNGHANHFSPSSSPLPSSPSLRLSSLSISSSSPFIPLGHSPSPPTSLTPQQQKEMSNFLNSSISSPLPPILPSYQEAFVHIPVAQMASPTAVNPSTSLPPLSSSPSFFPPSLSSNHPHNHNHVSSPITLPRAVSLPQLSNLTRSVSSSPVQDEFFHLDTPSEHNHHSHVASPVVSSSPPTDEVYQAATLLSVLANAVDRVKLRGSGDSVPTMANLPSASPSTSPSQRDVGGRPPSPMLTGTKRSFSSSSLVSLVTQPRASSPLSLSSSSSSSAKTSKRSQATADDEENGLKKQRKNCRGRPIIITQMNDLQGVDKIRTAQVFLSSLPYLAWMKQDDVVLLQLLPEFRANFGDGLKVVLETDLSRAMGNLVSRSLDGITGLETRRQNLTWPKRKFLQQQIDDLPAHVRTVIDNALESIPPPTTQPSPFQSSPSSLSNGTSAITSSSSSSLSSSSSSPSASSPFPSIPVKKDQVLVILADTEDMESYRTASSYSLLSSFSVWPDEVSYTKSTPVFESIRSMLEKYGGEGGSINAEKQQQWIQQAKGYVLVCFSPSSCSVTAKCRFANVLNIIQRLSPSAELRLLRPVCKNVSVLLSFERGGTVIQSRKQGKNNMSKRIGSSSAISLLVELGYRLTPHSPVIAHMRNVQNGAIHRYMSWLNVFIVSVENLSVYGPLHRLALLLRAFLLLAKQYRLLAQPQPAIEGSKHPALPAIISPPTSPTSFSSPSPTSASPSSSSSPSPSESRHPFPELLRIALFKEIPSPGSSAATPLIRAPIPTLLPAAFSSLSSGDLSASPLTLPPITSPSTSPIHSPSHSPSPSPSASASTSSNRKGIRSSTGSINATFGVTSNGLHTNGNGNGDITEEILPVRTAGPFYASMVSLWSKSLSFYLNFSRPNVSTVGG